MTASDAASGPSANGGGGHGSATRILFGLLAGAAFGLGANLWLGPTHEGVKAFADNVANPVGQIFLRLLLMVVIPLVFCSLTLGVAGLGDLRSLGRVGGRTIAYFLVSTAIATALGIFLVNFVEPGRVLPESTATAMREAFGGEAGKKIAQGGTAPSGIDLLINVVPKNIVDAAVRGDMLAVIFFALLCGIAATFLPRERVQPFLGFLDGFNEICVAIIRIAMKLAPFGVAGLIFVVTSRFGLDVIRSLALYLVTVLGGLLFHQFVILGLAAWWLGGQRPFDFFRRSRGLMVTAFSTSSSSATLPTTIRTAEEEFGVPRKIAGFVLPLGATLNMNGTALFEGTVILFLAQVAHVDLDLGRQILVVVLCVISAVGAAGVPGGSLPLLAVILPQVGIPAEYLAIILGVDRIVDMTRTVPNVTGDLTAALYVTRSEQRRAGPSRRPEAGEPGPEGGSR